MFRGLIPMGHSLSIDKITKHPDSRLLVTGFSVTFTGYILYKVTGLAAKKCQERPVLAVCTRSCFQMFAMVVLFGLIHGLVLLPICLSLVGPLPPAAAASEVAEVAVSNGGSRHLKAVNGANGTTLCRRSEEEASKPLNGDAANAIAGAATA